MSLSLKFSAIFKPTSAPLANPTLIERMSQHFMDLKNTQKRKVLKWCSCCRSSPYQQKVARWYKSKAIFSRLKPLIGHISTMFPSYCTGSLYKLTRSLMLCDELTTDLRHRLDGLKYFFVSNSNVILGIIIIRSYLNLHHRLSIFSVKRHTIRWQWPSKGAPEDSQTLRSPSGHDVTSVSAVARVI